MSEREEKFQISFTLTWVGVFVSFVVLLVVLIWSFILGVLVGRGYHPERYLQRLQSLARSNASGAVSHNSTSVGAYSAGGNKTAPRVLGPEELDFFTRLKKESLSGPDHVQDRAKPSISLPRDQGKTLSTAGPVYHYLYQVASFVKKNQALVLTKKLRQKGLTVEVEEVHMQGQQWFRVLVYFKGSPAQTRWLKNMLQKMGIERVFLRQKSSAADVKN